MNSSANPMAAAHWQIFAELPFTDLQPAHEEIRKLRHVIVSPFNADIDNEISWQYRGHGFKVVRCEDRLDILVDDLSCPLEILLEQLGHLISRLSRCSL